MSRLKKIKPNVPQADLKDYVTTIYGDPKGGKTTLSYNIGLEHYGNPEKTLLIGFEEGYKALPNIFAEGVSDWKDFLELRDELVEDKDETEFELLILDTIDVMSDMASDYIVRRESRADGKKYQSLSDIPWGRGSEQLKVEIRKAIDSLKRANYGLILVTHGKDKKIEPKVGQSYDTTTLSLNGKVLDVVKNISDFIVYVSVEREKVGGKTESKRYMYFRSDSNLEAGSRFKHVPEKVEYGATKFLEVFKEAVVGAQKDYKGSTVTQTPPPLEQGVEDSDDDFDSEDVHTEEESTETVFDPAETKAAIKKLSADQKKTLQNFLKEEYGEVKLPNISEVDKYLAIQNQIDSL